MLDSPTDFHSARSDTLRDSDEDEAENVEPLPVSDMTADPFYLAMVDYNDNGTMVTGRVIHIDVGLTHGERLYFVRFDDGDSTHLTQKEVSECLAPRALG